MNAGNAQTENVSGGAKLSCTRATVRSVGRLRVSGGDGNRPGRIVRRREVKRLLTVRSRLPFVVTAGRN